MNNQIPQDEDRCDRRNSTRGIITAAIICLLIITVAIYLCINAYNEKTAPSKNMTETQRQITQSSNPAEDEKDYEIKPFNSEAYQSQANAAKSLPQSYYTSQGEVAVTNAEPAKEELTFITPMSGEVIRSFSDDTLVFSPTLKDWRAHFGTDFYGEAGTKVSAVADGVVKDIAYDELYGNVLTISHDEGYESVYCGISDITFFDIGDEVKQGEVISTVSGNIPIESSDKPHLHFELMQDGAYIDLDDVIVSAE